MRFMLITIRHNIGSSLFKSSFSIVWVLLRFRFQTKRRNNITDITLHVIPNKIGPIFHYFDLPCNDLGMICDFIDETMGRLGAFLNTA